MKDLRLFFTQNYIVFGLFMVLLRFLFIVTELEKNKKNNKDYQEIFNLSSTEVDTPKWVSKCMKVTKQWLNFDSERTIALHFPTINQSKDIIMTAAVVMNQRETMYS